MLSSEKQIPTVLPAKVKSSEDPEMGLSLRSTARDLLMLTLKSSCVQNGAATQATQRQIIWVYLYSTSTIPQDIFTLSRLIGTNIPGSGFTILQWDSYPSCKDPPTSISLGEGLIMEWICPNVTTRGVQSDSAGYPVSAVHRQNFNSTWSVRKLYFSSCIQRVKWFSLTTTYKPFWTVDHCQLLTVFAIHTIH